VVRPTEGEHASFCQNTYRAVCKNQGISRDPTGSVRPDIDGELETLRLYESIIREHPDWNSEQVDEQLVQTVYTAKRRDRMTAAFHWVRSTLESFIERQPESVFNSREKKFLKKRIRQVKLELPTSAATYADEPDLFTKNDVFYQRTADGQMRLRIGGAFFFTTRSWFNLVFTLGHELGHAIDPCELRSIRMAVPAYDRLTGCLLKNGLIAIRKERSECGPNDQLSETFADWVAVQVAAEALKGYATEFHGAQLRNAAINSVRDLCEQEDSPDEDDLEFHPSPRIRIERIFGQNPSVRATLGCAPPGPDLQPYCDFESPIPTLTGK
jgi:hypothetical protein